MSTARAFRRPAVGALCGFLLILPFAACAATAGFHVAVQTASTSQGTCASGPSTGTADFQVTCTSGQFVSMLPLPPHALAGIPSRILRFNMLRGAPDSTRYAGSREPPLPVTAMRVSSDPAVTAGPVEILVSF